MPDSIPPAAEYQKNVETSCVVVLAPETPADVVLSDYRGKISMAVPLSGCPTVGPVDLLDKAKDMAGLLDFSRQDYEQWAKSRSGNIADFEALGSLPDGTAQRSMAAKIMHDVHRNRYYMVLINYVNQRSVQALWQQTTPQGGIHPTLEDVYHRAEENRKYHYISALRLLYRLLSNVLVEGENVGDFVKFNNINIYDDYAKVISGNGVSHCYVNTLFRRKLADDTHEYIYYCNCACGVPGNCVNHVIMTHGSQVVLLPCDDAHKPNMSYFCGLPTRSGNCHFYPGAFHISFYIEHVFKKMYVRGCPPSYVLLEGPAGADSEPVLENVECNLPLLAYDFMQRNGIVDQVEKDKTYGAIAAEKTLCPPTNWIEFPFEQIDEIYYDMVSWFANNGCDEQSIVSLNDVCRVFRGSIHIRLDILFIWVINSFGKAVIDHYLRYKKLECRAISTNKDLCTAIDELSGHFNLDVDMTVSQPEDVSNKALRDADHR
jgi:hypothetical protein